MGKVIDPVADRLLVIVGLFSVAAASGVPWWFALTTLAREVSVSVLTLASRSSALLASTSHGGGRSRPSP